MAHYIPFHYQPKWPVTATVVGVHEPNMMLDRVGCDISVLLDGYDDVKFNFLYANSINMTHLIDPNDILKAMLK